jgi:hypothetical protein
MHRECELANFTWLVNMLCINKYWIQPAGYSVIERFFRSTMQFIKTLSWFVFKYWFKRQLKLTWFISNLSRILKAFRDECWSSYCDICSFCYWTRWSFGVFSSLLHWKVFQCWPASRERTPNERLPHMSFTRYGLHEKTFRRDAWMEKLFGILAVQVEKIKKISSVYDSLLKNVGIQNIWLCKH